ncbi:MAG: ABC transporter ATP-binding protein [Eubacteriaceae bacterium]|nr:ABC transporter ATP-binding protein [Eubacteriaceae bacterium]
MLSLIYSVNNIISILGKYKKSVRLGYLAALLESFMAFTPYMVLFYIVKVGLERAYEMKDFYLVAAAMFLSVFLRALFKRWQDKLQQDKGYYAFSDNRLRLTDHLAKLNMGYYTEGNIGNFSSVVTTDIVFIEEYASSQMGIAVSSTTNLITSVLFLFFFDYRLGIVYVLLLALALYGIDCLVKAMKRNVDVRQKKFADLSSGVISFIKGMQTVKAFNMQRERSTILESEIEKTQESSLDLVRDVHRAILFFNVFSALPVALMVVFVSYWMIQGSFDLAYGIGFIVSSFVMFMPVMLMGNAAEVLSVSGAAIERYKEMMSIEEMKDHRDTSFQIDKMNICFQDVSFAYEDKEVLKNIHLEIKEKTFTALVGKSGSGKSTIANLIVRFWDVEKGEILIDGKNIKEIPQEELLSNISMVFQNVYLFHDTVFNNIAFGNTDATKEEVIEAAKKARCHDFIMALEKGYDAIIGEGGATLSGGEKQRISIARAILKDAKLILLDEATAGIDPENEKYIQEAIEELVKSKTLIVIAHRFSTIQNADKIVFLEDGEIVEEGSSEELLALDGKYKRQYDFYRKISASDES